MFQLRDNHHAAFRDVAISNFEDRAIEHVRLVLLDATASLTDVQLLQRVKECTARSAQYGLTSERQIMYFVDATFIAGEFFDSVPDGLFVREILSDRELAGDDKAILMLNAAQGMAEDEADDV